jgi:hypothetical protein
MRLPFVSRAMHEAVEHQLNRFIVQSDERAVAAQRQAENWKALYENEVAKRDALVEKLLAMKQQGFQTATERQMPTPLPASRIDMAIDDRAGSNAALRRHLYRWAAGQQASKVSEDVIVDRLTTWQSDEGAEA